MTRLRRCGATAEELAEVYRRWAEMTDDEKRESVQDLRYATDDEIREGIAEMREDAKAESEPGVPDGTVAQVLEWAGDDPERRRAALLAEMARPERDRRSTLVAALGDG